MRAGRQDGELRAGNRSDAAMKIRLAGDLHPFHDALRTGLLLEDGSVQQVARRGRSDGRVPHDRAHGPDRLLSDVGAATGPRFRRGRSVAGASLDRGSELALVPACRSRRALLRRGRRPGTARPMWARLPTTRAASMPATRSAWRRLISATAWPGSRTSAPPRWRWGPPASTCCPP